ncbi:S58 family peptidase [Candidatus Heimdallarchaeota archaeon]|nr:MAG: S58 family peptidase [Candidatus Gerdarchaeota archaeon]RLI69903.1 MAG: S58 family peptidase [Candidatus Gerdarchaeota archaeon]RLI73041.1 MAG: S58 family peptidase [Candidatus Heimdallarchaeota archaeon]
MPSQQRPCLRSLGFSVGLLPPGTLNAITDVPGVLVGHSTIIEGEGKLVPGKGPIRTGVTVILPHSENIYRQKVPASSFVLNGYGKTIGLVQIEELGYLESIIALTNTLNVPLVANALIDYHLETNPDIGINTSSINVVVAECNDGYLNDIQGRHVKKAHVFEAIKNASQIVTEGAVGAGTGMSAFGFKGGIGTASRIVSTHEDQFILGVLVLTNFGRKKDLLFLGHRFLELLSPPVTDDNFNAPAGSIIVVLATNAPLTSRQLKRLAKRIPLGIARTGGMAAHYSGDIIIAFSTANKLLHDSDEIFKTLTIVRDSSKLFGELLQAAVEATEEAILNSLLKAQTIVGRDGHQKTALPLNVLQQLKEK